MALTFIRVNQSQYRLSGRKLSRFEHVQFKSGQFQLTVTKHCFWLAVGIPIETVQCVMGPKWGGNSPKKLQIAVKPLQIGGWEETRFTAKHRLACAFYTVISVWIRNITHVLEWYRGCEGIPQYWMWILLAAVWTELQSFCLSATRTAVSDGDHVSLYSLSLSLSLTSLRRRQNGQRWSSYVVVADQLLHS